MSPVGVGTSRSTHILKTGEAKLWVFLVGVNQYQDERLSSLRYSALDCRGLGEALVKATQGFPNKEVMTHHDFAAQTPKSETVRANLQQIISQTQSQDTILFYFSGHGVLEPNTQQAILCLADTQKDNLLATGLGVQELLQMLDTSSAHQQLICLDTCHSGDMMPRGARAAIAEQRSSSSLLNPTAQLVQLLRQRAAQSKGFCALLSCDQGQQSWEFPELGHGVFTYYLIRGLLGEAADSQGVIEADGLYKYVYHQTLQYINQTNQQLRLINQQKRSRGETQLHPEYPLQTPKRIVEGVGELILGLKPAIASNEPRRQGLFVEGLSGSKTTLALSQVLSEAGGFELEYWPQTGKTWSEVRGAIQACLRWRSTSKRESLTSLPATEKTVTALLYLRGRVEEIEDGEAWLVLGEEVRISRSWLRQELRRSGIAQQIVVLDCPGSGSLYDWVEDLQIGSEQGQCLIAAAATAAGPELFSQALLETLVAAPLQVGLPVAEWTAQLQLTLAGTGIPLHVWLSGTQGVIEILPGNRAPVLPITPLPHHPCSLIPSRDYASSLDDDGPEKGGLAQASSAASPRHHSLIPDPQSLARAESDPNLVLDSEQYSQLEQLLMTLVGPIAPILLRKVSAQASSPQEVIDSLALNLPQQQRLEFEKQAISLLQESIQAQTKSCNSLRLQHQPINDSLLRQCERELADLVGPIASFLIQKALESHPQISLTELVNILTADFSDPQKALEFQHRLLS